MEDKGQKKRRYRAKPTQKQLTALQLIAQGTVPRQAMLKAGYSQAAATQPSKVLYRSNAVISVMDNVRMQLKNQGLTTSYLVGKYKQLLESPEEKIQLEAVRDVSKLWGLNESKTKDQPTRRITLEEYLDGKDNSKSNVLVDDSSIST